MAEQNNSVQISTDVGRKKYVNKNFKVQRINLILNGNKLIVKSRTLEYKNLKKIMLVSLVK